MAPKTHKLRTFAAAAALVGVCATLGPVAAQDRDELNESIEQARDDREEARKQQLEAETQLSLLEAEDVEVKAALESANELVATQQAEVDAAETRLDAAELSQTQAEVDLAWATQDIEDLKATATVFAIESYMAIPRDEGSFFLEGADPNLSVRRSALLSSVGRDAIDALDALRAAEEDRDELAKQATDAAEEAEEIRSDLANELEFLEEAQATREELANEMDSRIADIEAELDAFEAEEAALSELIREKQLELAGLEEDALGPGAASAEGFVKPTAGGIASGFGPRLHPILGYYRMHNGLDIGGAMNQPIWSAKAGEVILAGWNGGYGNTVVVAHPGGVTTLYAHMSSIQVSVGTKVDTGEIIGLVGSTGLSTGPHLHFETRVNGGLVDPLLFIPAS